MKIFQLLILIIISVSCATSNVSNKIYWVNSAKVSCKGVAAKQCYNVQKGDTLNWDSWQIFYSSIDGFEFEPGYIYKLLINEKKLIAEDVPADASSIKYSLVKVLEKEMDIRLRINGIWILETLEGETIQLEKTNTRKKLPQIELDIAEMRVSGNDGCNNFFGGIKNITPETIQFKPIVSTKKACLETNIPAKFNIAFGKTSAYKVENLKLFLFDDEGKEILIFKKADKK